MISNHIFYWIVGWHIVPSVHSITRRVISFGAGLLLLFSSAIWTVTECIALLYLRGFDLLWCTCYSSGSNHGNRYICSNMDNIPDRNVSQWNCLQRTCRSVLWYLTHLYSMRGVKESEEDLFFGARGHEHHQGMTVWFWGPWRSVRMPLKMASYGWFITYSCGTGTSYVWFGMGWVALWTSCGHIQTHSCL